MKRITTDSYLYLSIYVDVNIKKSKILNFLILLLEYEITFRIDPKSHKRLKIFLITDIDSQENEKDFVLFLSPDEKQNLIFFS